MIEVLRMGHRPSRDKRITTHVGLVSRALGAEKIYIPGNDLKMKKTLERVVQMFGGDFQVDVCSGTKEILRQHTGVVVHLTMYGMSLPDGIRRLETEYENQNILTVVGAQKVPRYIFERADLNVSVGNQPHSEVAALALFLDRISKGTWMDRDFGGKIKIIPDDRNKRVIEQ